MKKIGFATLLVSLVILSSCSSISNETSKSQTNVTSTSNTSTTNSLMTEVESLKKELLEKEKELASAETNKQKISELEETLSEKNTELQQLKAELNTIDTTMTDEVAEKIWNTLTPEATGNYIGFQEETTTSGWYSFQYQNGVGNVPVFRRYGDLALVKWGGGGTEVNIRVLNLNTQEVITSFNVN